MSLSACFSAASPHWSTPSDLFADLDREFSFDFDPCPLHAKEGDIPPLLIGWGGRRVFCNPPYGPGVARWLQRAELADIAVFLLPARTDTRWFHDIVLPNASEVRFLKGRLKFGDSKNGAPFPSMLVIFRKVAA